LSKENSLLRKSIAIVVLAVVLCSANAFAQSSDQPDSSAYTLGFSTYLWHTDRFAAGFDITTDSEGNIYVTGNTRDKNFPATEGAYQTEIQGEADAFVAKLNPEGELVFATLIGGTKREHHAGVIVDDEGYIYMMGGTHSSDFPVTDGAYDTSFNGEGQWAGDVYVTKINPTGSEIVFSTFVGGDAEDTGTSIQLDSKGDIVIGGGTHSKDFPVTDGVIQPEYTNTDCFIAKLSADGDKLLFSTSLGRGRHEMITSVAVDDKDNIFVTGFTATSELPTSDDALRKHLITPITPRFKGGIDHFVAKINKKGTELQYLSYLGAGGHMGTTLSWASPNRLVVCGSTNEKGFPITDDALGKEIKGDRDCYITVFNSDDMTLEYSTVFGGSEADNITSVSFLEDDTLFIGGKTNSADFPLTKDAAFSEYPTWEKTFDSTFSGRRMAFVSVIDIKNRSLVYSTYVGACFQPRSCSDESGNICYIAEAGQRGESGMTGFPVTEGALMEPPTYLMLGRLVENTGLAEKK
jgi:Beta-propeller repeat